MADPTETGRRVLDGLRKGRERAIAESQARARTLRTLVLQAAQRDADAGNSAWGRPGRIAMRLRGLVSDRHVRRILASQSSVSDYIRDNGENTLRIDR